MKKILSTVVAFALAGVLAVSAFAAGSGYTKDQLKNMAASYMPVAASYGVSVSANDVNTAIDALTAPEEVDVEAIKAAAKNAKDAIAKSNSQSEINKIVVSALNEMKAACGSNTIEIGQISVELTVNGVAKINGSVTVNGVTVNAQGDMKATAPVWTDDSKQENNGSSNAAAPASTAAAGVIKATGMNTASVAVVALSVVAVLGVAAVKARKLGE